MTKLFISLLLIVLISCGPGTGTDRNKNIENREIKITWIDDLSGDFSFKDEWSYPENIFKNEYGQLSCDGFCPTAIDSMKDEKGKIFEDSLLAFYRLVDTTHLFHSILCEAQCYEWAGTNFITANKMGGDTVTCLTHTNAATHSSLNIVFIKGKCTPTIALNSISGTSGTKTYSCKSGEIKIDKSTWDENILKAEFNFEFDDKEHPEKPMYWKGKIYTKIEVRRNYLF